MKSVREENKRENSLKRREEQMSTKSGRIQRFMKRKERGHKKLGKMQ